MNQPTVTFLNYKATVVKQRYAADNSLRLQLFTQEGAPLATATVCLEKFTPPEGYACIKDYSENVGILEALTKSGIVEPTEKTIPCGYEEAHLVKVLI